MEERCGGLSTFAVHSADRVVEHNRDDVAGIVGGGDSGEGNPVHAVRVAVTAWIDLLRGASFAGNLIALYRGLWSGALLVAGVLLDDSSEHIADGTGCFSGYDTDTGG